MLHSSHPWTAQLLSCLRRDLIDTRRTAILFAHGNVPSDLPQADRAVLCDLLQRVIALEADVQRACKDRGVI